MSLISKVFAPDSIFGRDNLETQEEREQFMEQFWFRRASDPDSPDNDFKIEYYRRIAFANEKFGGQLAGWKTDRGRIYVLFGPPDSVKLRESGERTGIPPGQGPETYLSPTQEWYYPFIEGIGERVRSHPSQNPPVAACHRCAR